LSDSLSPNKYSHTGGYLFAEFHFLSQVFMQIYKKKTV